MPKNHSIRIRLSTEDHDKIAKKAALAGLEISSFVRLVALQAQVNVTEVRMNGRK